MFLLINTINDRVEEKKQILSVGKENPPTNLQLFPWIF